MTFEGVKWCWSSDSSRYIWFQICGAAEEKAGRPKAVFILGTRRRDVVYAVVLLMLMSLCYMKTKFLCMLCEVKTSLFVIVYYLCIIWKENSFVCCCFHKSLFCTAPSQTPSPVGKRVSPPLCNTSRSATAFVWYCFCKLLFVCAAKRDVYLTFKALNISRTGCLTQDEFMDVYTVNKLNWKVCTWCQYM